MKQISSSFARRYGTGSCLLLKLTGIISSARGQQSKSCCLSLLTTLANEIHTYFYCLIHPRHTNTLYFPILLLYLLRSLVKSVYPAPINGSIYLAR
jgi:hypothetical protein